MSKKKNNNNKKFKKLTVEQLRKSEGKVCTEDLFVRDTELAIMFIHYMQNNIRYLRKYEYDDGKMKYEEINTQLSNVLDILEEIDECFKKHNSKRK